MLNRMIRAVERIRPRSRRQQPSMPREKVLEAQVGHEVSRRGRKSVVILPPMARQHERLRFVLPLHALDIEPPQVPFCVRDIRRVRVQVLDRQRCNFRRSGLQWTQIPLRHGYLRCVHGLHDQFAKGILCGRKRCGRQEPREFGKHRFQGKIARPHAQVSMVGHCDLKPLGLYRAGRKLANRQPHRVEKDCRGTATLGYGDVGYQLLVLALFARSEGSVGGVKLCAISLSRSRRDSPTPANTWAQASRSFSSAVAAIPEIISRDWWSTDATVASIHWFETFSSRLLYCSVACSPIWAEMLCIFC